MAHPFRVKAFAHLSLCFWKFSARSQQLHHHLLDGFHSYSGIAAAAAIRTSTDCSKKMEPLNLDGANKNFESCIVWAFSLPPPPVGTGKRTRGDGGNALYKPSFTTKCNLHQEPRGMSFSTLATIVPFVMSAIILVLKDWRFCVLLGRTYIWHKSPVGDS